MDKIAWPNYTQSIRDTQERLMGNGREKIYHANIKHKKVEMAKLTSNEVDFKIETVIWI